MGKKKAEKEIQKSPREKKNPSHTFQKTTEKIREAQKPMKFRKLEGWDL